MSISFDRVADRYDATRPVPDNVMETILNALEKVLVKDKPILDAGVGTGRFAKPLQDRGYYVVGVDVAKRMLTKATEKGTEDLVRGDLCMLPFEDRAFETTMSIHVMHVIKTWRCALGEIARVTSKNFISVSYAREESPAEDFRRFYEDSCRKQGFELRHPGLRERELTEILTPDESKTITIHEHMVDVEQFIEQYENRVFSNQWDVPDEIHEQAIDDLKQQYENVEEIWGKERISLIVWNADRIREFAGDAQPQRI
ncbi:MAG TPA: class I SAM-dependent methyltransferase [Thermoplasmata archaeon]